MVRIESRAPNPCTMLPPIPCLRPHECSASAEKCYRQSESVPVRRSPVEQVSLATAFRPPPAPGLPARSSAHRRRPASSGHRLPARPRFSPRARPVAARSRAAPARSAGAGRGYRCHPPRLDLDRLRGSVAGCPSILRIAGLPKEDEADRRRHRIAGSPEQRSRPMRPNASGFPGFIRTCQIATSPSDAQHVLDQVVVAERDAARRHDQVGIPRLVESPREIVDRVARDTEQSHLGAPGPERARQSRRSCCRGSSRAQVHRPARPPRFRSTGLPTTGRRWTRDSRLTDRRDQAQVRRPSASVPRRATTRTTGDVLARLAHIVEWLRGADRRGRCLARRSDARTADSSVSSKRTTASAPTGSGAPVMMRIASPALEQRNIDAAPPPHRRRPAAPPAPTTSRPPCPPLAPR